MEVGVVQITAGLTTVPFLAPFNTFHYHAPPLIIAQVQPTGNANSVTVLIKDISSDVTEFTLWSTLSAGDAAVVGYVAVSQHLKKEGTKTALQSVDQLHRSPLRFLRGAQRRDITTANSRTNAARNPRTRRTAQLQNTKQIAGDYQTRQVSASTVSTVMADIKTTVNKVGLDNTRMVLGMAMGDTIQTTQPLSGCLEKYIYIPGSTSVQSSDFRVDGCAATVLNLLVVYGPADTTTLFANRMKIVSPNGGEFNTNNSNATPSSPAPPSNTTVVVVQKTQVVVHVGLTVGIILVSMCIICGCGLLGFVVVKQSKRTRRMTSLSDDPFAVGHGAPPPPVAPGNWDSPSPSAPHGYVQWTCEGKGLKGSPQLSPRSSADYPTPKKGVWEEWVSPFSNPGAWVASPDVVAGQLCTPGLKLPPSPIEQATTSGDKPSSSG
eukprot:TRINITY_DN3140_c0_g1_i1.p1 TRINITY_DN3140_c0_g1~~TRINITY_DN3140_c0_g1_i1.p1  ORF type:complete len:435 (-),score=42.94 TRINITY_DN3140_c0_g1_i1:1116-2420(-)